MAKNNVVAHAPPLPKGRDLSADHRAHLHTSGLTDVTIAAAQLYSEPDAKLVAGLVNWSSWRNGPVLVLPFFEPGKAEPFGYRIRPDRPRSRTEKGKVKVVKYEQPKNVSGMVFFPPNTRRGGWLTDATRPLCWTEGEKKALLLDQLGYATIGGTGTWMFHDPDTEEERRVFRPMINAHTVIAGRVHYIVFDSDADPDFNSGVFGAAEALAGMLWAAGALDVRFVRTPGDPSAKVGIDDYFVASGEQAQVVHDAIESAKPMAGTPPEEVFAPMKSQRGFKGAPLDAPLRMPSGYTVDRKGGIWKSPDKPEGEDRLVAKSPILIRRIVLDLYSHEERVELTFKRKGTWRTVLVDRRAMCEARSLIAAASAYGAPIEGSTAAGIVTWLSDVELANDKRIPRMTCVSRTGWHQVDDDRLFVAPGLVDTGEQVIFDDRSGKGTVGGLGTKGDTSAHLAALRGIVEQSTAAALAVFGSLAAPLLERLDAPNFAIHLHGDSSRGKSTMLRAGASVFGDPFNNAWVATWNSTNVGHEFRAYALSGLPFCADESGVTDERERAKAVYMLINGTGRARGQKDGGLRQMLNWHTVVLSTGEPPLVADDAHTGAQIRVLQCPVDGIGEWGAADVDAFNACVRDNHGHAGQAWLQALSDMSEEEWAELRSVSRKLSGKIAELGGGSGIRARQAAYIATLMVTERLAHKLLGLGDQHGGLTCALADQDLQDTPDVESAAERALSEVAGWVAATLRTGFARMSGTELHDSHVRSELAGYYRDEGRPDRPRQLWVLPRSLKKVLKEHGHDMNVLREWRQRGWIDADPKRYDRTQRVGGRVVRLVCLDPETFWGPFVTEKSGYNDE